MTIFCAECGHELREGAQFCGACGHQLAAPAAAAAAAEPPPPPPPPPPEPPAPPGPPAPPQPPAAGPPSGPPSGPPAGPPSGPPGGPPSGPPPAVPPVVPPAGPPSAAGAGGGGNNQKLLLGLLGLLVVAVIAVAIALVAGGGSDKASKKDREVLLESAASVPASPFTPDLQTVSATVTTTVPPAPTTVPPSTVGGATGRVAQGPFGGTGDNTLCDRELLVSFLTDPANAQIAKEWARVLSIDVSEIPTYIRALIPTTLTQDARVTNHNFVNGRAVGYQAVLQAGTAVLVDTNGRLIARCRCGNPLLPPQEIKGGPPVYTGPRWEGFNPTVVVVVVPSPTPIYPPGGVGTLPQSTTPTTTGRRPTTTTTTFRSEPDAAIAKLRTSFEACTRAQLYGATSSLSAAEIDQVLASAQYSATLTDQKTGTYRVVVTIPDQSVGGGDLSGGTATWDVNLLTGDMTPVDENANTTAAVCPDLA